MLFKKFISLTVLPVMLFGCQKNLTTQTVEKVPENTVTSAPNAKPNENLPISRVATSKYPKPTPRPKLNPNDIVIATCPVAAISGTLKVKGQCLVISGKGAVDVQPFFNAEEIQWDEINKILTYLGKQYREGDFISLGGGLPNNDALREQPNVSIPDCPNSYLFSVCP